MFFIWWARLWPYVVLSAACTVVFGRSITGEYLSWDDTQHILLNPWLISGDIGHFWKTEYYGLYIPLTYTLWTWIFQIWPFPSSFHLLNILLHIFNSWLVFWLSHKILSIRKKDSVEMLERGRVLFALIAALVFALHPFQVETVAWISGGRDLMAAFFGLLAAIVAWNTADRLFPSWAAVLRRSWATILFVGALLCKPALAVLPPAVKWLSWFTERRGLKWSMMWLWLGLGAAIGGLTAQVQAPFVANRLTNWAWSDRARIAADSLWFYLRKFVVTDYFSADYGRIPERVVSGDLASAAWAYLLVISVFLLVAWRWLPGAVKGGLGFFVVMLSPVIGFFGFSAQAFSTVYDRYMYLPIVGLGIALASAVSEIKIRLEVRLFAAFLVCGWWGWNSFKQVPIWQSDKTLYQDVLKTNPASYNALVNIGITELNANNLPEAHSKFEAAQKLNPRLAVALSNLAHVFWLEKNPGAVKEIGALLYDKDFIAYNRQEPQALSLIARMLGRVLIKELDFEKGREAYCYAARLNPFDEDLADELDAVLHDINGTCSQSP